MLRLLAALAAVGVLVAYSIALGWGGSTLFRGRGPAYLAEEVGLLTAALLWCAFGAAALARTRRAGAMGRAPA